MCLKCNGLIEYKQEKDLSGISFEYFRCLCCGDRIYNQDMEIKKMNIEDKKK